MAVNRVALQAMTNHAAPALMLLGVSSNAGKSLLAAGLCRVLKQEGVDVAPFKAQNMSLNSYVTPGGCEIGRAQALQAAACNLEPDPRMNPILLKPSSDVGSQVIVMGKPLKTLKARDYYREKKALFETVKSAYDSLAAEHQAIILEGAGSPAEVNLKAHDIVNTAMAAYAGAPSLLVGDIDRGGVFAHFIGTLACLDQAERDLIAGFVVNKFRGDKTLLGDALTYTEERTGKPFFGVLPYLENHGLPEEDSVSFKERGRTGDVDADIAIACVDLPRISNFTDLDALRVEPDTAVTILREPEEMDRLRPDALILPGSKSTLSDLSWMRERGWDTTISDFAASGGRLIGICGGYQMLGSVIADPDGLESDLRQAPGLNLLPLRTNMAADKILARTTVEHLDYGMSLAGYEIHHGRTEWSRTEWSRSEGQAGAQGARVLLRHGDDAVGHSDETGRVWGCYLHGLFDDDAFRRRFLNEIRCVKGLEPIDGTTKYNIPARLDCLADALREHLDMQRIFRLLNL